MHDRTSILTMLDATLRGAGMASPSEVDHLKTWHVAAHNVFLRDAVKQTAFPELAGHHWQFSYSIERSDGEELDPSGLIEILREVNGEVHDLVETGWTMFYPFTRSEIAPFFTTDPGSGQGDKDFLECALLRDINPVLAASDMWRVSPDGKATLIRPYWEDDSSYEERTHLRPGTWFGLNLLARSLGEFIRHARGLTERFTAPTMVSFHCEWNGLANRQVYDAESQWYPGWVSRSDHRIVTGAWPISTLASGWPDIVATLGSPVVRLFTTGFSLTPEWVQDQSAKWRK